MKPRGAGPTPGSPPWGPRPAPAQTTHSCDLGTGFPAPLRPLSFCLHGLFSVLTPPDAFSHTPAHYSVIFPRGCYSCPWARQAPTRGSSRPHQNLTSGKQPRWHRQALPQRGIRGPLQCDFSDFISSSPVGSCKSKLPDPIVPRPSCLSAFARPGMTSPFLGHF